MNEADADITDSPNTVQTPHGTKSEIHSKNFAQIQAINVPQPAFSTQPKEVITQNYQYGTDLQEHLQNLSTTRQFGRATTAFKLGTKRKYQEVTRRSDVTPDKKRNEKTILSIKQFQKMLLALPNGNIILVQKIVQQKMKQLLI